MPNTHLFGDVIDESAIELAQLSTFCEHIPTEWVAQAAELSAKATIRRQLR